MAEKKLPRLLAAAKEFNVGQDTIVEFLIGKDFPKDDLKPTSKLTDEMYTALQQEFQSDKAAKMKSDQVDLPKGGVADVKKKKEDVEITFKKDEKPVAKAKKEEEVAPVAPVEEEAKTAKKTKKEEEEKKEEPIVKIDAPEVEGPKVVTKIDLSAIDSSTRPKKGIKAKKVEETKPIEEKQSAKPITKKLKKKEEEPVAKVEEVKEETPQVSTEEDQPAVIENIERQKLSGPKILGKIELPVNNDTRPVKEEKKKRKRIPIEKKEIKGNSQQQRYSFIGWILQQDPVAEKQDLYWSNPSYVAAALMLEKATGKNYETLVAEFGQELKIQFEFGQPNLKDKNQPWGHDEKLKPEKPALNYKLNWLSSAGNINVSLPDYSKFIQLQLQGLLGKSEILTASEFEYMHYGLPEFSFGWKWFIDEKTKLRYSFHEGNPGTFLTKTFICKEQNKAFILFANVQSPEADTGLNILLDELKKQYGR